MSDRKADRLDNPRLKWWRNPGKIAVILVCLAVATISLARLGMMRKAARLAPSAQAAGRYIVTFKPIQELCDLMR